MGNIHLLPASQLNFRVKNRAALTEVNSSGAERECSSVTLPKGEFYHSRAFLIQEVGVRPHTHSRDKKGKRLSGWLIN